MPKKFRPKAFVLQWHVTERCNWRCKHCYQEEYGTRELDLEKMEEVLVQYANLLKKWELPKNRARVHISGGEPFFRKDFLPFLEILKKYSGHFDWCAMSNGSLLDEEILKRLKELGILFLQLSLEGTEKTNDEIRGFGSFQKVIRAIKLLKEARIPIRISLTLTKQNFREVRELANILAPLGVSWLAVRRIAPFGAHQKEISELVLEPLELRALYHEIEKINADLKQKKYALRVSGGCENAIFNDEISSPGLMDSGTCGVNNGSILTLMPGGDVLICRRFPIKIGDVLEKSLEEIYYSPIYEDLRGKNADAPLECYACPNVRSCLGGAKCVTSALTGINTPDVQCWKLFKSLDESVSHIKRQNILKKLASLIKFFKSPE